MNLRIATILLVATAAMGRTALENEFKTIAESLNITMSDNGLKNLGETWDIIKSSITEEEVTEENVLAEGWGGRCTQCSNQSMVDSYIHLGLRSRSPCSDSQCDCSCKVKWGAECPTRSDLFLYGLAHFLARRLACNQIKGHLITVRDRHNSSGWHTCECFSCANAVKTNIDFNQDFWLKQIGNVVKNIGSSCVCNKIKNNKVQDVCRSVAACAGTIATYWPSLPRSTKASPSTVKTKISNWLGKFAGIMATCVADIASVGTPGKRAGAVVRGFAADVPTALTNLLEAIKSEFQSAVYNIVFEMFVDVAARIAIMMIPAGGAIYNSIWLGKLIRSCGNEGKTLAMGLAYIARAFYACDVGEEVTLDGVVTAAVDAATCYAGTKCKSSKSWDSYTADLGLAEIPRSVDVDRIDDSTEIGKALKQVWIALN